MSFISFLELGVGAVVQSALYKPLAEKDTEKISQIITSAGKFFRYIAYILLAYVVVLFVAYPFIVNKDFDWLFSALLIGAMSISFFAQYYFGVVDRLLLTADQKGYIQYIAQIITLVLNTGICVLLILVGASIQIVKLTSSLIFLLRPVFLRIYVNKHYQINRKSKYESEPIKQKWNGIAQHISAVVLNNTDIVVLTLLSSLSNVSVYSVYHLVTFGMKNMLVSVTSGMGALLGDEYARNETDKLNRTFDIFEWIMHFLTILLFTVTAFLIVPFVRVYTRGITDTNYIHPVFSIIMVIAYAVICLQLPYNTMIHHAGHFKQTQLFSILEAVINVVTSVILVYFYGLIGVAIGTLAAVTFRLVYLVIYLTKRILNRSIFYFLKILGIDLVFLAAAICTFVFIPFPFHWESTSYAEWIVLALEVFGICFAEALLIYGVFSIKKVKILIGKIKTRFSKRSA